MTHRSHYAKQNDGYNVTTEINVRSALEYNYFILSDKIAGASKSNEKERKKK